jgi:hypothetical protein
MQIIPILRSVGDCSMIAWHENAKEKRYRLHNIETIIFGNFVIEYTLVIPFRLSSILQESVMQL